MSRVTVAIHDNCAVGVQFVSGRYMHADAGRRTVAGLLELRVRIPPESSMPVSGDFGALSD
jgi:hypothetical protein